MKCLVLIFSLLVMPTVWAADVILCAPSDPTVPNRVTRYLKQVDSTPYASQPDVLIWTAPHESMTLEQSVAMQTLRDSLDGLTGLHDHYWKCGDGIVVAMSPVEQDAVDAPAVAEAAKQAVLDTEASSNDWCNADLDELTDRINTVRDGLNTEIGGITNIASARTVLTSMNTTYAAGFRKLARCLKARVR